MSRHRAYSSSLQNVGTRSKLQQYRMMWIRAVTVILIAAAVSNGLPAPRDDAVWTQIRGNIKHVIYLMMENHSFDNIGGYWSFHPGIDNLLNLGAPFCNAVTHPNWTVWGEPLNVCAAPYESEVPLADPDHGFPGTAYQIYGKWDPTSQDVPNMSGFIERQVEQYSETPGQASFVIKAYNENKTATLLEIAKNFAFFDSYHAEHPGPTNPNRQFATSGSTCGYIDNTNQSAGWYANVTGVSCATSIFEALTKKNITWKNYYETDIIDSWMYKWVQDNAIKNLVHADQIFRDLEDGTLPQFSYYNPECCNITSMHPKSNMATGEQMIKHLYDAVRGSQLIILNFDEHGGFADHVPPPVNIPAPQDGIKFNGVTERRHTTYDFTRLGVRVPAFLISPWIPANTLIHDEGTMYAPNSAYTHTSFLHFLQELWDLDGFNNRVQWAKTFEYVFTNQKREDAPANLTQPIWYGGIADPQPYPFYLLNQQPDYYKALGT
ncbi:Phosphoesterase family domain containing protein [Elaphomyces granulatus]